MARSSHGDDGLSGFRGVAPSLRSLNEVKGAEVRKRLKCCNGFVMEQELLHLYQSSPAECLPGCASEYDPPPTTRLRHEPPENDLVFPFSSTSRRTCARRDRIPPHCPSEHVTHRYGDRVALDRLDLDVPQGEVLALLGPNGAGKSTTISALLGLVRPQEGRVEVLGCDPRQAVSAGRVGAMLQSGSGIGLPPGVRVDEALRPRPAALQQAGAA